MTDDEEYLSWVFHYKWQAVRNSPLGRNLAVAGALCAAWDSGYRYSLIDPEAWHPGCRLDEYERMRHEAKEYAKWR